MEDSHGREVNMRNITKNDLLTIIEDVGFGRAVVGGADRNGIIIDGYLDLATMARQLDRLVERRLRREALRNEQAR
jgi:hypothetical protein